MPACCGASLAASRRCRTRTAPRAPARPRHRCCCCGTCSCQGRDHCSGCRRRRRHCESAARGAVLFITYNAMDKQLLRRCERHSNTPRPRACAGSTAAARRAGADTEGGTGACGGVVSELSEEDDELSSTSTAAPHVKKSKHS